MKLYVSQSSAAAGCVAVDDMILTTDQPTAAGSKMLDGYMSLFGAEVVEKIKAAGYEVGGKVNVGEFSIDMLGETSFYGECADESGKLAGAVAEVVKADGVKACLTLDVNGMPRRAAAIAKTVFLKPTYGTVSRYGTIPVACSGETVGVMANTTANLRDVLEAVIGHDDKDGTSLSDEKCALLKRDSDFKAVKKIAVIKAMTDKVDGAVAADIDAFKAVAEKNGIEVCEIDGSELLAAKAAWNVLMSAELCNNVSRYDGVKYGYRTPNYTNIDELYTNSRTEAFGMLLKSAILYGSQSLLYTEKNRGAYDKSLRVRRVVYDYMAKLFEEYDALLMPVCSKAAYTKADTDSNVTLSFEENVYTAPASITGLPAVVVNGVQLVGKAFSDSALLAVAEICEKEGK
ncbi:MAG: hypothetical protein IJO96_08930 [Oscillospiraceae bacterium]|nr:hypothetical protein [Oscillospiraceae bacterium]